MSKATFKTVALALCASSTSAGGGTFLFKFHSMSGTTHTGYIGLDQDCWTRFEVDKASAAEFTETDVGLQGRKKYQVSGGHCNGMYLAADWDKGVGVYTSINDSPNWSLDSSGKLTPWHNGWKTNGLALRLELEGQGANPNSFYASDTNGYQLLAFEQESASRKLVKEAAPRRLFPSPGTDLLSKNLRGSGRKLDICDVACTAAEVGAEALCALEIWFEPECGIAAASTETLCAAAACGSNDLDDSNHHAAVKKAFATSPFCNGEHTGPTAKSRKAQQAFCAAPWEGASAF